MMKKASKNQTIGTTKALRIARATTCAVLDDDDLPVADDVARKTGQTVTR
jgi:hypothetical protein